MDDPNRENDKQFEAFLRQFQLRQAGPLTESISAPARAGHGKRRWSLAAAVIAVAFLSTSLLWDFTRSRGPSATIEVAGDSPYKIGEKISGTPIRAGRGESTTLVLEDGSRVEMRAQSEVAVEGGADGVRLRLDQGAILVTAAKQPTGHVLQVKTNDALISVLGTEFVVEARPSGTRIGVLHGEVEVRHRETLHKLLPGGQIATNPSFEEQSLAEMIAWSRDLTRLKALLQQSSLATQHPEVEASTEESTPYRTYKKAYAAAQPHAPQRGDGQEPPSQPEPQPTPEPPQQTDAGADGPGKEILLRACSSCHTVDLAIAKRFPTREAYADRIARDRQKGAGLSDGEASTLADYLFKTYGAKKGAK